MKPAAPFGGVFKSFQRGSAAVELAVIISATIVLIPAVTLVWTPLLAASRLTR